MKTYRDYADERVRRWAKRRGLTAMRFTPPRQAPFNRVWFEFDQDAALLDQATRLYGRTRGGYTA